ncbi:MAG: polyprenyl synthetase family protein, partial [Propionibacteriaceae bacterium]|nr:polyprenyl synthetase family protein [Propionibacteriaceae bacterium]
MLDPAQPLSPGFKKAVDAAIKEFLAWQRGELLHISQEFEIVLKLAGQLTAGGKRLRPAFAAWGYLAGADSLELPDWMAQTAASLDLLHASALVHDDVMDGSDLRRGQPAAHLALAAMHRERGMRGDAAAFGRSAAILLGNLLWNWASELCGRGLAHCPDPARLADAQEVLEKLRVQVNAGQYLDVVLSATPEPDRLRHRVEQVVEYKTARYSVAQPLQLGAILGGGSPALVTGLRLFGELVGRAFQYRDDVLGVFGDESVTGKPAGDDLREGKLT